jgi:hypothetical protein
MVSKFAASRGEKDQQRELKQCIRSAITGKQRPVTAGSGIKTAKKGQKRHDRHMVVTWPQRVEKGLMIGCKGLLSRVWIARIGYHYWKCSDGEFWQPVSGLMVIGLIVLVDRKIICIYCTIRSTVYGVRSTFSGVMGRHDRSTKVVPVPNIRCRAQVLLQWNRPKTKSS